jgi:STE24 endopeptidase
LLRLPASYWRGFVREHRWGFSTQSRGGWVTDRLKALGVGWAVSAVLLLAFVGLARALPDGWPWAAAAAAAAFVLLVAFVAPVVLEPLFNRFRPLEDASLAGELRALARRAGVPIREVLVADASRRSRKENAYVSGLGATRRVVLYDTLLGRAEAGEVLLVAAHELGHRRLRHVATGTAVGMAGMVVGVWVLWALLRWHAVLSALAVAGPGDPRVVPFVLLAAALLQVISLPFGSALSRRWERAADRFSLDLTGRLDTFVTTHRELALANVADLDPPRLVYRVLFTHPTPPERIALARRWAPASI